MLDLTQFVPPFRLHEPEKSSEATTQVCCSAAGAREGEEEGGSSRKHLGVSCGG